MTTEKELHEVLARIYERRCDEIRVSAAWLATEAMIELDPDRISPPRVYAAAHLELRQLARSILRSAADPTETGAEQHELFPGLQRRYPTARGITAEEPEYVKLEHLTEEDVRFNVARLRAEATTKLAHADALEAWWQNRTQSTGQLFAA